MKRLFDASDHSLPHKLRKIEITGKSPCPEHFFSPDQLPQGSYHNVEDVVDAAGHLRNVVILGFSRSGSHLVSYTDHACPASNGRGGFSLQLWTFAPGQQCSKLWTVPLFDGMESDRRGRGGEWAWMEDTSSGEFFSFEVFETTDSSLFVAHAYQRADMEAPNGHNPRNHAQEIESEEEDVMHFLTVLPGPAALPDRPASLANFHTTLASASPERHAAAVSLFEMPREEQRSRGRLEKSTARENWSGVPLAVGVFMNDKVAFFHFCAGTPAGRGWIDAWGGRDCTQPASRAFPFPGVLQRVEAAVGPRACWSSVGDPLQPDFAARAWVPRAELELLGVKFSGVRRGAPSGGQRQGVHGVALRAPSSCLEVETALGGFISQHGLRARDVLDFDAVPLKEGGVFTVEADTNSSFLRHLPGAAPEGPSWSPDLRCSGLLVLVVVLLDASSERVQVTGLGADVAIVLHVPLSTGLAHILYSFPHPHIFKHVHPRQRLQACAADRVAAVLEAEAAPRAPRLPRLVPTSLTNASLLRSGESVAFLKHSFLPQVLLGYGVDAEDVRCRLGSRQGAAGDSSDGGSSGSVSCDGQVESGSD